jgi:hypothetical protein
MANPYAPVMNGMRAKESPDAGRPVQHVAVSSKRRTVGGVVAHITRPRQVPILTTAWGGAHDAATP